MTILDPHDDHIGLVAGYFEAAHSECPTEVLWATRNPVSDPALLRRNQTRARSESAHKKLHLRRVLSPLVSWRYG
eukprot:3874820-Rhodomonas_salina.1